MAAGLYGNHNLQNPAFHDLLEWIDVSWGYVNKAMHNMNIADKY